MDVPSRRDVMDFTKPYTEEPFVIATKADKHSAFHNLGNNCFKSSLEVY